MNLVGSGCWKTFNFKSMKNSKSSSVKPTSTNEETTIPVIKKESKKGSKDNRKQSEQSKSPLLKTLKSNYKHGSFRESAKGGVGVGKGLIAGGNNQITGSNNISLSTKSAKSSSFTMVTNLRRAASFPLIVNSNQANRAKQHSNQSVAKSTPTTAKTPSEINNANSESMFTFFDKNATGFISEDELVEMMGSLGEPISPKEARLMIQEADVNRDGKIDYTEFRNLLNRLPLVFSSPSTMSLQEAFDIFDTDSDGYVNLEEVKLIATAVGIDMNEKSLDTIKKQLKSIGSTSSSPSSSKRKSKKVINENEKVNLDQLRKIFDSIVKK